MTVAKSSKQKIEKRTPGLVITPPAPRPAGEDNPSAQLFKEARAALEAESAPSVPLSPSDGQTPTPSVPLSTRPTAPDRDFNKRANSIERDALPSGMFPGASKKIYDALYLRTRGAVRPERTIRATKKEITDWSGVRNRKTIDSHLRYLETCGLVVRQWELGNNDGYLYEINIPDEIGLGDRGGQRGVSPLCPPDQNLDRGTDQNLDRGGQSQVAAFSTIYAEPKTFKTNTERSDDDEAGATELARAAKKLIWEITGKEATQAELGKITEIIEVLTLEGKIAAARTTVSSAGPFLAEHLRRRLFKKNKQEIAAETAVDATINHITDASGCPDCAGVGWYYPEGKEKGMAKCKHLGLISDKQ